MGIEGVPKPETIIEKTSSAEKVADKATEAAAGGVKSAISEAAEAVKTAFADSDGDGQEHNEL